MLLLLVVACLECEEVDPGQGCDLIQMCCNDAGSRCEYRTREDEVYECGGGQASCDDDPIVRDVLCDVCTFEGSDPIRSYLKCGQNRNFQPPEHPE